MLNTRIIANPINWAIVILMLVIAGMGGHLLMTYLDKEPATSDDTVPSGYSTEQAEPDFTGFGMYASLAGSQ
jgi:hypothetical protein